MSHKLESYIQDFIEHRISAKEFETRYIRERNLFIDDKEQYSATVPLKRELLDNVFSAIDRYESDPEIRGWQYWNEEELLDEVQEQIHWYKFNLRKSELGSERQKNEFDQSIMDTFKAYFSKEISYEKFLHMFRLKFITLSTEKLYRKSYNGFTEDQFQTLKNLSSTIYKHKEKQDGKDLSEEIENVFRSLISSMAINKKD